CWRSPWPSPPPPRTGWPTSPGASRPAAPPCCAS
ncbi:MAG: hypothetical protein AVDCRST_MAG35-2889, partial [uncultured Quadrisphaera sp.]